MPVTTALRSPTVQGFFAMRPYSHSQKTADRTDNAPAGTSATITSSINPCTVRPAWMCGEDDARFRAISSMRLFPPVKWSE